MSISEFQYRQMLMRAERKGPQIEKSPEEPVRESDLHDEIQRWCDGQWPRWKYVHARTDKKSTLAKGVADFVVFGPWRTCIVVECKRKDGKQSEEQLCWATEMKILGWDVKVVRSFEQFLGLVKDECAKRLV